MKCQSSELNLCIACFQTLYCIKNCFHVSYNKRSWVFIHAVLLCIIGLFAEFYYINKWYHLNWLLETLMLSLPHLILFLVSWSWRYHINLEWHLMIHLFFGLISKEKIAIKRQVRLHRDLLFPFGQRKSSCRLSVNWSDHKII